MLTDIFSFHKYCLLTSFWLHISEVNNRKQHITSVKYSFTGPMPASGVDSTFMRHYSSQIPNESIRIYVIGVLQQSVH